MSTAAAALRWPHRRPRAARTTRLLRLLLFATAALATSWAPRGIAAQQQERGMLLFHQLDCSRCHAQQAQGDSGPSLAGTPLSLEAVIAQLRQPSGAMPRFGPDRISDEDIVAIYAWLQSLSDQPTYPTWFSGELIDLSTPLMPGARTLEIHFSHRFSESIMDAGRQGFWGLDSFAAPAFWLAYGLTDRLQVHGGRSSNRGTWEYGAKVEIVGEGQIALPLSAGAVVGGAYLDREDVVDRNRFTLEIPVGLRLHERLSLLVAPLLATNTDPSGDPASASYSAAIGVGGTFRVTPGQSIDAEWVTNVGGFRYPEAIDQWQIFWGIKVGGHVFQIGVTNSVAYTVDQMAPGTVRTGSESDVRLGFNLVRAFAFGSSP